MFDSAFTHHSKPPAYQQNQHTANIATNPVNSLTSVAPRPPAISLVSPKHQHDKILHATASTAPTISTEIRRKSKLAASVGPTSGLLRNRANEPEQNPLRRRHVVMPIFVRMPGVSRRSSSASAFAAINAL